MDKLEHAIQRKEKINRTYGLNVRIVTRELPLLDDSKKGGKIAYTSRMIYLVPEVSTQSTFFFDAWLPTLAYREDFPDMISHNEIAVMIGCPLYRAVRCGVCRKNKNYPEAHHIVLISSEAVEDVLASMEGQIIEVKVLPDLEAEAALG